MSMQTMDEICTFCRAKAVEPTTETIVEEMGGVKVTVEGVPARKCRACGEQWVSGKIDIPIDAAIEQILVATGAAAPPDPAIDAQLEEEMRELARSLGQEPAARGA